MHKRKQSLGEIPLMQMPQLLTVAQVASVLQVGQTTVYALINQEGLPYVMVGSVKRVPATGLTLWIEQRQQSRHERAESLAPPRKYQRRKPVSKGSRRGNAQV
jgi:excisionase family DNA binding protein